MSAEVTVQPPTSSAGEPPQGEKARRALSETISRGALWAAISLLVATFFLFSPPRNATYPGAIPWSDLSVLRPLVDLLSLEGLASTARGTEIKDFAFHLAAAVGLALLAWRLWTERLRPLRRRHLTEPWFAGQILLIGWVALSGLSSFWSGDAAFSVGQAALYGLALAWALGLAWSLDRRHVERLLSGLLIVAALGSVLCVWYFHERNPHHRPGFPIGNPATLSAAIVPAILIALCRLLPAALDRRVRSTRRYELLLPLAALIPLAWCFWLTYSRSAMVGLAIGLLAIALFHGGRRLRWAVMGVVVIGIAAASVVFSNYSRLDAAMARGATIRFRVYAWRYAAELWNETWQTSVAGQGAGAYPRLSGQLSVHDRALDPAAFMGELVEHAHNELFEVLSEIGLVGGVTFVGGWLAVLATGAALLRTNPTPRQRWLYLGVIASLVALMTDACFSPALRLAGVPAVFYTLIGVMWALGRAQHRGGTDEAIAAVVERATIRVRRPLVQTATAVFTTGLVLVALFLAGMNWQGALLEAHANDQYKARSYETALDTYARAETRLLDPVRKLVTAALTLQSRLGVADESYQAFFDALLSANAAQPTTTTQSATELDVTHAAALQNARDTYQAAAQLSVRAPTLLDTGATAARAAELICALYRPVDQEAARQWYWRAWQAWHAQSTARPYDSEALLALTQYPALPIDHAAGLRDALRDPNARYRRVVLTNLNSGRNMAVTFDAMLRQFATQPEFAKAIDTIVAGVGPVTPQTDLDALIASMAPEAYRLKAQWEGLRENYDLARRLSAQAALLYEPMRPRFPEHYSLALLEQADFTLRRSPNDAPEAVELLKRAIDSLPVIQEQKYEEMAGRYRSGLIVALLAAGSEQEAADVAALALGAQDAATLHRTLAEAYVRGLVERFVRRSEFRANVETWLASALRLQPGHLGAWSWTAWLAAESGDRDAVEKTLHAAAEAGVPLAQINEIRRSLTQEFPAVMADERE